ncbi:DNA recombination protein RmuC [Tistlia consotensis]|uniref:DNA recombination protein RmuC homolog n=1 Tax=Tistlia consotensis USBA 355 TaxID=560819 RepID=A0A1Y6CWN3_9PROT|nr:DNA recombination protein RmuC [Tistlia consotensis]SMF82130.1 DNA recombination protein RmuC [Tistlia consotensis USBA 355]SNS25614.1 DNA recombination protein RmuC [Tistlia consotensis]
MPADLVFPLAAALAGALVAGLVVLLLARRLLGAGAGAERERLQAAEAELAEQRAARAELERQLAEEGRRLAGLEVTAARVPELERQLTERATVLESTREQRADVERDLATARSALQERGEQAEELRRAQGELKAALEAARATAGEQASRIAALQETLDQERRQSAEKLKLLADTRETMTKEFKLLADEVMKTHGTSFAQQNKDQVEGLLKPLRDRLQEFQQGLQSAHTESAKERATLAEQIKQLSDHSARMSSETQNLTRALKGKAQTQGAWGEMILSTILERSGLREGEEYTTQDSHTTEEGQRVRSDVLVNLPGGQRIVIDSKVSLTAFEECVNAEEETGRAAAALRHVTSMRGHIRTLGSKDYHLAAGSELDYVIMFVPIEGALAIALEQDPALTAFAADSNVAIATPTTLMVALRTVANVWQVERRNRNAEQIASRAGRLYDKFVGFAKDMESLGTRLDGARQCYDQAMGKLSTGNGNLVRQVEQLKQLGAKASKALPATLKEEAAADDEGGTEDEGEAQRSDIGQLLVDPDASERHDQEDVS